MLLNSENTRIKEAVSDIALVLTQEGAFELSLSSAARVIANTLNFSDCVIYTAANDRDYLVQRAAVGPKSPDAAVLLNPIQLRIGQGIVGAAAASGEAILVADTQVDTRYVVDDASRRSELAVPIVYQGQVVGVIDSEHPEPDHYTGQQAYLLNIISGLMAQHIAKALEIEALYHEIRRLRKKVRDYETAAQESTFIKVAPSIPKYCPVTGSDAKRLIHKLDCSALRMCALLGINMSQWSGLIKAEEEAIANVSVSLSIRLLDIYPQLADESPFMSVMESLEPCVKKLKLQEIAVMLGKDRTTASAWRRGIRPSGAVISLQNHLVQLVKNDPQQLDYYRQIVEWEARSRQVVDIWKFGSWSKKHA